MDLNEKRQIKIIKMELNWIKQSSRLKNIVRKNLIAYLPVILAVGAAVKCITLAAVVKYSGRLTDHRNLGIIGIIGGPGNITPMPGTIGAIKPNFLIRFHLSHIISAHTRIPRRWERRKRNRKWNEKENRFRLV